MINDSKSVNTYLLYLVIDCIRKQVNDDVVKENIDLDCDTFNTITYVNDQDYHYWFYDVSKEVGIYLHEVIITGQNQDLVLDKEYKFDTMALLIKHISNIINTIEEK